jgi:hypothetical protein
MSEVNPFQPIADLLKPLSTADKDTLEGIGVEDSGASKSHAKKPSGAKSPMSPKPAAGAPEHH